MATAMKILSLYRFIAHFEKVMVIWTSVTPWTFSGRFSMTSHNLVCKNGGRRSKPPPSNMTGCGASGYFWSYPLNAECSYTVIVPLWELSPLGTWRLGNMFPFGNMACKVSDKLSRQQILLPFGAAPYYVTTAPTMSLPHELGKFFYMFCVFLLKNIPWLRCSAVKYPVLVI